MQADGEKRTIRGYLPGQQTKRDVTFTVVGGRAIFEGDVDLGNAGSIQSRLARPLLTQDEMANWKKTPRAKGRMAVRIGGNYLWPKGRIPYAIDTASFGRQKNAARRAIRRAIKHLNRHTNLRIVPKKKSDRNYIRFRYLQRRCSSPVGIEAKQDINIDPSDARPPSPTKFFTLQVFGTHKVAPTETNTFESKLKTYARAVVTILVNTPGRVRTGKLGSLMSPTMFTR